MPKITPPPGEWPKTGQPFRFRGNTYVVDAVDILAGAIRIKRPAKSKMRGGHYKLTEGSLRDIAWAGEDGGFWYFRGTIAESMRGLPVDEQQAIQLMPIYGQGRDDLAIAAFHGEPRGVPGARSLFHGREDLRPTAQGIAERQASEATAPTTTKAKTGATRRRG